MTIEYKNWDNITDEEVQTMLQTISGDRCAVCNGVCDYHMPEVARLHLKMLSNRKGGGDMWRGIAWGAILMSIAMTALWHLTN